MDDGCPKRFDVGVIDLQADTHDPFSRTRQQRNPAAEQQAAALPLPDDLLPTAIPGLGDRCIFPPR